MTLHENRITGILVLGRRHHLRGWKGYDGRGKRTEAGKGGNKEKVTMKIEEEEGRVAAKALLDGQRDPMPQS